VNSLISPDLLYLPVLLCVALCLVLITFYSHHQAVIRGVVFTGLLLLGLRYEAWRLMDTLNLENPWVGTISVMIFLAEMTLFLHFALCSFLEIWQTDRTVETQANYERMLTEEYTPWVDVYITTYNEDPSIVKKAIIGCQAMAYAHKTVYLLDDGNRPEMKRLSEQYQCQYIARSVNTHYKAGNLNHALGLTQGEFIACFDADFIPTTDFLLKTLGYFDENSQVALVQTPQSFYNSDPIENNLGLFGMITNEQELFFKKVQPSRDASNAVICCGTSYVIRRSSVEEIGGFPTTSITEDFLTSIALHAKGYQVVYVNEMLSAGDAPGNIGDYINQRIRWCRGIIQSLYSPQNPLFLKGLTLQQRAYHTLGIYYWVTSMARVMLMLTPLFFLIFDMLPIQTTPEEIIFYFLPFYLSYLLLENWLCGGKRSPFWSDLYECLISFPVVLTVVQTLLKPLGTPFQVTPKLNGTKQFSFNDSVAYPILVVFLLYGLGFVLQFKNWVWEVEHAPAIVNLIWGGYNLTILWLTLQICCDVPQKREEIAFLCKQKGALHVNQVEYPITICEISSQGVLMEFPIGSLSSQPKEDKSFLSEGVALPFDLLSANSLSLVMPGVVAPREHAWVSIQNLQYCATQTQDNGAVQILSAEFGPLTVEQERCITETLFCQPGRWFDRSLKESIYFWNLVKSIFRLYPLVYQRTP
jgi:cellulose synthase (UDP-forming)